MVAALHGQRVGQLTLLNAIGILKAALPGIIALVLNRSPVRGHGPERQVKGTSTVGEIRYEHV